MIDSLLNSLADGGEEEKKQIFDDSVRKERKYDFKNPKKFTKERLKLLDSVYSTYSRVISSYLSSLLRLSCEVTLVDIEEQKYNEFNNALGESDILTVIEVAAPGAEVGFDPLLLQISNPVIETMLNRMMGGAGDIAELELDGDSDYSDIELSLFENLVRHIIPLMTEAFRNYLNIEFAFSNVEVNPRLVQTIPIDETVVILMLDITLKDTKGNINICLSSSVLEYIFRSFEMGKASASKRKEHLLEKAPDDIMTGLSGTTLEISAKLSEAELLLKDVLTMRVGDIINLNKPKDSDAVVYVEDVAWFTGEIGIQKHNIAVRLNSLLTD